MRRFFVILLSALIALQAVGWARGEMAVLCLGGGHAHGPAEDVVRCELACGHGDVLSPVLPADDHDERCSCVDVEFTAVELLSPSRAGSEVWSTASVPVAAGVWVVAAVDSGLCWRGPPRPAWFDPGTRQRLAVVASTRLIL